MIRRRNDNAAGSYRCAVDRVSREKRTRSIQNMRQRRNARRRDVSRYEDGCREIFWKRSGDLYQRI